MMIWYSFGGCSTHRRDVLFPERALFKAQVPAELARHAHALAGTVVEVHVPVGPGLVRKPGTIIGQVRVPKGT